MASKAKDLTDKRFSYLTALRRTGLSNGNSVWVCRCDCGETTTARADQLQSGRKKSCGIRANHANPNPKWCIEDYTRRVWRSMQARCGNPKSGSYQRYGARGVAVCERWSEFANFQADMGWRPPGKTIDRRDNARGYEPGNCRWATRAEQDRNKRTNVYVAYAGERILLIDLAAKVGVPYSNLSSRIRLGWSAEDAVGHPIRHKNPNRPK